MHLVVLLGVLASGLADRGIYADLDGRVAQPPPAEVDAARAWLRFDAAHRVLTLYDGGDPLKAYAADAAGRPARADDAAELERLVPGAPTVAAPATRAEDHDGDGLVDRLDIVIGARKLLANRAQYIERYLSLAYPNGDVPRGEGVCSDTIVRALRNAGIDLQREVHEDILRARRAYPMVDKVDASINHRRVRTLLPWFERHFVAMPRGARYRPGDVLFFDTLPARDGPDHIGIVSDRLGERGLPLVINNWTVGAVDAEMDLLSWVPVTHHFRAPAPPPPLPPTRK